jgi:hypothetical protein
MVRRLSINERWSSIGDIICALADHEDNGMMAVLRVK